MLLRCCFVTHAQSVAYRLDPPKARCSLRTGCSHLASRIESPRMGYDGNEWVIIYRSRSEADCREHALVLHAAGTAYEVGGEANEFTIAVATTDAARSRTELDAYAIENRDWRNDRPAARQRDNGWSGVLGFIAVLSLMSVLEQQHAFGVDWFAAGKTHAGLIRDGEWWRTVTALTLHADLGHVLSNLVIGGLVGLFAGQSLGSGLAWCSILIAGALGNFLNAWVQPPDHTSVGASTAVFAALGLLAAHAWWQRRTLRTSRLERWAPLVGGVLLLSFLGTGGGRTDVAAHVFGFLCAVPIGALCVKLGDGAVSTPRVQFLLGLIALTILAVAWAFALMPHASWRLR